jgi:hypothetical protein
METLESPHVLPAERKLISAITHADVSIDDVVRWVSSWDSVCKRWTCKAGRWC